MSYYRLVKTLNDELTKTVTTISVHDIMFFIFYIKSFNESELHRRVITISNNKRNHNVDIITKMHLLN